MELSTADPVPTSVRFYLAALLSNSAGREICRCFFSPHKQIHQAKLSQAADGSVRRMKRKMFCSGSSCAFGKDAVLNKVAALHFLAKKPSFLFCLHTGTATGNPWEWRENFSDLVLEIKEINFSIFVQSVLK